MTSRHTRRDFLKSTSALLAGTGSLLPRLAQTQSIGEDYWNMVRAQFAFTETAVPMNAANLCPSFRAVSENRALLTADIDIDCSFNNRSKFGQLHEQSRELIARQLNVSADEIALVRNTSEANNIVNNGLPLQRGDEVLIWDQNHPTNNVAWDVRAARFGVDVTRLSTPQKPDFQQNLIDSFVSQFTDRTRVLALTHVSNVSGIRLPVAELAEAAQQQNIYVHLDGAQSWGALNVDLRALNVDSYSASAHKWYMGPREVGLLYVRESNIERIWPNVVAPGWGDDAETDLAGARKFESLGQRDDAALAALGMAAKLHDEIGPARTEARIRFLAQRLKAGIESAGLQLVTPFDETLSHGVCITRVSGGRGSAVNNQLYDEYGIAGAPTGGLRLCPTIYNTPEHVDRAIDGLTNILT